MTETLQDKDVADAFAKMREGVRLVNEAWAVLSVRFPDAAPALPAAPPPLNDRDLMRAVAKAAVPNEVTIDEIMPRLPGRTRSAVQQGLAQLVKLGEFERTRTGYRFLCDPTDRPNPRKFSRANHTKGQAQSA